MRTYFALFALPVTLLGITACKDLTGGQELPAGIVDPASYNTEAGAERMWQYAVTTFGDTYTAVMVTVATITDESMRSDTVDKRRLPAPVRGAFPSYGNSPESVYEKLQQVRTNTTQAIGVFVKYGPAAPPERRGELYALRGYAEILLADLFCSGVPLSTLNFEGDFTYKAGSSTHDVYEDAVAQFDSALALSAANDTVLNLARVGKGRALLALGRFADAAQAVAEVPDGYVYFLRGYVDEQAGTPPFVANREGVNGLPYVERRDPRVAVDSVISDVDGLFRGFEHLGPNRKRVASGVEARLIQAEAALHADNNASAWLTQLNVLRTTGDIDEIIPDSLDPTRPDTVWHAGTGGVSGLPLLQDPGSDTARVTLMFSERAFWLFNDAHRQGDLRRLIRQYGRKQDQVYPTGVYPDTRHSTYGSDVNLPVPSTEFPNPQFQGCINRDA